MSDDEKTLHCAIGIGALEQIRYEEKKLNPKSARSTALDNLIDNAEKVIAHYKMNDWPVDKLIKSTDCLNKFEAIVRQAFNAIPHEPLRRAANGRMMKREAAI